MILQPSMACNSIRIDRKVTADFPSTRKLFSKTDVLSKTDVFNSKLGFLGNTLDGVVGTFEKMGFGGLSKTLGLDEAKKKMAEVAQVQADITNLGNELANLNKDNLSDAQIRAGFGGKELKEKQLLLDKLNKEAKLLNATNGKFSVLMAGLKSMGKSSLTNLMDPVALMTQMQSALVDSDKAAGQLAKDFNMTYAEALSTRRELSNMATLSGDVAVNTKGLQESILPRSNFSDSILDYFVYFKPKEKG